MHPKEEIERVFQKLAGHKVLVIGDVMLDKYLSGSVRRISPEAPVPVLNYEHTRFCPGGAANVAINMRQMGSEVWIAAVVGQDEEADQLCSLLDEKGIHTNCLIREANHITTTKTRVMASNQHLLRVDREEIKELSVQALETMLVKVEKIIKEENIELVVFQDYDKGLLSRVSIDKFLGLLKKYNVKSTVDPKYDHFYSFNGVDIFKPNLHELKAGMPFPIKPNREDLEKAAKYVREKINCSVVLITLSDKGIFIDDGTGESHLLPVTSRSITDVCGAGDTVISIASLALLAGFSIRDLAYWSAYAGTIVCQYPGVVPINMEMLTRGEEGTK